MNLLFRPAEALMNRFNYPIKFGLLGLLVLIAFASLMLTVVDQLEHTIERSEQELEATALARPMFRLVELTQQHRGLSSMVLGGNAAMGARRGEREAAVEAALAELNRALPGERRQLPAWQAIQQDWATIRHDGLGWTQARNMRAHTELVEAMLRLNTQLADAYGLTFDPEAQSYYLMAAALEDMPFLIERIARLRGSASAALARGSLDDAQRIGLILLGEEIRTALDSMQLSLDKVIGQRPQLGDTLTAAMAQLRQQAARLDEVVQALVQRGDFQASTAEAFFSLATETIAIGYRQMHENLLPGLDGLLQQRIEHAYQVLLLNVGVALVVLALIGYLSVGAYLSVMTSVRRLREGSEKLAAGDLTTHIRLTTRDELRHVAGSFNAMADAMRGLIGSIRDNSDQVADSARSLASASGQIHVASQCQSDAASSMAAAVEQMTVGIEHIARHAGEADSLAHHSGELSRQGGEIVSAVVEEIRLIAASVADSARTVAELGERSGQISAIVEVIGDIAAQTNLLALNAAIEAARAGEQGRGFAVVADEVRKLAERTAQSTREIGEMVASIQQGTAGAVQGMEQGVQRVNEGVQRAQRAGEAMHGIREAANQVQGTVAEISSALREQSAASVEIAQKVSMIAQMAEENGSAVGSNHQTASRLSDLAGQLLGNVSRFRAG
ncbi:methyl-accepting chemotaxis protein [Pseudomonas oligotrophica]|uniref:methyl-accepting chemotaxis protein n=1 Tax=Pseudomonas oligotrophica TaxID=2912055 RepID=UPI001F012EF5|nr:methyl-accepting chemotaxis protein [Pseudomonas oligotrophica]MCF7203238.1 methyl-accepting chemotaxis protein [Pseudomonas oligotrophica]